LRDASLLGCHCADRRQSEPWEPASSWVQGAAAGKRALAAPGRAEAAGSSCGGPPLSDAASRRRRAGFERAAVKTRRLLGVRLAPVASDRRRLSVQPGCKRWNDHAQRRSSSYRLASDYRCPSRRAQPETGRRNRGAAILLVDRVVEHYATDRGPASRHSTASLGALLDTPRWNSVIVVSGLAGWEVRAAAVVCARSRDPGGARAVSAGDRARGYPRGLELRRTGFGRWGCFTMAALWAMGGHDCPGEAGLYVGSPLDHCPRPSTTGRVAQLRKVVATNGRQAPNQASNHNLTPVRRDRSR